MSETSKAIQRHHHITLCVGGAQEDYDFHTEVLGLKSVKKTALYDGDVPIYHLYYGNDTGSESTLVTTFPMRQSGRVGRRGTNQAKTLMLAVPETATDYWRTRLVEHGFEVEGLRGPRREAAPTSSTRAGSTTPSWASATTTAPAHRPGRCPRDSVFTVRTGSRSRCVTSICPPTSLPPDGAVASPRRRAIEPASRSAAGGSGRIVDFVAEPGLDQGRVDVRRGHHPSHRLPGRRLRHPDLGQVAPRRDRLHRRVGAQGPRLLRVDLCPHAWRGRSSRPPSPSPRGSRSTSPMRNSARRSRFRPSSPASGIS